MKEDFCERSNPKIAINNNIYKQKEYITKIYNLKQKLINLTFDDNNVILGIYRINKSNDRQRLMKRDILIFFIFINLFQKIMLKIKENMEGKQSNQLLHGIAPFYIFN